MSFKTAPRYLSGVSVFLGDDITKRDTDGELVFFIGQSTKGPSIAIDLKTIDNLVPIFGNDNPMVKAAYEFWDGFADSKQVTTLRPVALRVGGIPATLITSYGITFTTTDAYDAIEDSYFIFVDNSADVAARNIKIWDKNKQLVYNDQTGINTGHFIVSGTLSGSTDKLYGTDLSGNPQADGTTMKDFRLTDEVSYGTISLGIDILSTDTAATLIGDITQIPSDGIMIITNLTGKVAVTYSVTNYSTSAVSIAATNVDIQSGSSDITFVGSALIEGDSQLNLTDQELYEKFRNALLDVETFTPDYLIPGGPTFDAKGSYLKDSTLSAKLSSILGVNDTYAYVDAAATWPATGSFTVGSDQIGYKTKSAQTVNGLTVYALELVTPVFRLQADGVSGATTITVTVDGTDPITAILSKGIVSIGSTNDKYNYSSAVIANGIATLTLTSPLTKNYSKIGTSGVVTKTHSSQTKDTSVHITFSSVTKFATGIGYVQETDNGDSFSFKWSDTKFVPVYDSEGVLAGHETYSLAHFGYLFANFCQEASIGYNTPLCGMNVSLPTNPNDRPSVVNWIGSFPTMKVSASGTDAVEAVTGDGIGLLGDAILVGSQNFNRCYMSNPLDSKFVDPAYGLLLTEEGFVDGTEIKDTYGKVVDLGKFLCIGAGLLTFANRVKNTPYMDTMGIYALGLLAGTPKNEGISFSKIGSRSNVSITSIVSRKLYNDLARAGYIVPTREKGLGWVINNDNSAVRKDSGYFLISTTRTIKDVIERKRSILAGFIGKPMNRFYLEAAKTKVAESFAQDITGGFLNGFTFTLDQTVASTAIGKLLLKTSLNPALELVSVDIDSVIDRNVTSQG